MKIRLLNTSVLVLILFTFLGCNKALKKERDELQVKIEASAKELENCIKNNQDLDDEVIYFNVVLTKEKNDEFQLVHIEGKYNMPYVILGKFIVETDKNKNCILKSIEYKLQSVDGRNYKFDGIPSFTYNEVSKKFESDIRIGLSNSPSEQRGPITSNINKKISNQKILDIHIYNNNALNDYLQEQFGKEDDKSHWVIKCCGGAICKVKFNTGG